MAERFETVFTLEKNLYVTGSPVVIAGGRILKDTQNGAIIGQVKFVNICEKEIKALTIRLKLQDVVGRPLPGDATWQYLDFMLSRGQDYGTQIAIAIPEISARRFVPVVEAVVFSDNSLWENKEAFTESIPPQRTIQEKLQGAEEITAFRKAAGIGFLPMFPDEYKGLRRCSCGALCFHEESTCWSCKSGLSSQFGIDLDEIRAIAEAERAAQAEAEIRRKEEDLRRQQEAERKAEERRQEQARLAEQAKQQKRKKVKRIAVLVASAVVTFAAVGIWGYLSGIGIPSDIDSQLSEALPAASLAEEGDISWTLNDGTLKIYGRGKMPDYSAPTNNKAPWFDQREKIIAVEIQPGVTSIGADAFFGCDMITVSIPDSVTIIGRSAFTLCKELVSITIPDSVTDIAGSAFDSCSKLSTIAVSEGNTSYVSVDGALFTKDMSKLVRCPPAISGEYHIPDGVSAIGPNAFYGCFDLLDITIPTSVTDIEEQAFRYCTNLNTVTIPAGVTSIGQYAFGGCSKLTGISISNTVTAIEDNAFIGCKSLKKIAVSEKNEKYTVVDGVLFSKGMTKLICCPGAMGGSYTIPTGVAAIGGYAFYGCSNLTGVTIPTSVRSIGRYSFEGCSKITSITIPDGVRSIEGGAFSGCSQLAEVTIPGSVTSIGWSAFGYCKSLAKIHYQGTKEQWENTKIGTENDALTAAEIEFILR